MTAAGPGSTRRQTEAARRDHDGIRPTCSSLVSRFFIQIVTSKRHRMSQRPDPAALTTQSVERTRPPRRIFALGNMQFRVSHARVCDAIMDGLSFALEGFVYLIGPLLILLALFIIGILTYTFFTILLPMLQLKYAGSSLVNVYLGLHASWVVFIVVNVLFNYFMCVTTRNKGANYDKLVRELAVATNFCYPETPVAVTQWKKDYEDRMYALMRRRQAQARNAAATIASESNGNTASASSTGMIQRRAAATAPNGTTSPTSSSSAAAAGSPASTPNQTPTAAATVVVPKPTPVVYRWMLMGPLEWGYCNNSKQPKPPRSHYDHVSTALVLNLDHYCPWMFNASTYFNLVAASPCLVVPRLFRNSNACSYCSQSATSITDIF